MSDILGSLFELGTAFADVAVDTIGDVVNATRSGFLRQPRSIKRALEWIACCCSNENRNSLEKALKKLPGFSDNSNIKDLLQKLGGDTPDGIYANAKWEDLCKNTQGGTNCCASTGGKGGCSGCKGSGKSCDGCCYDCPQIICARMFCLILPIVYYFLEYLIKFDEKAKNNSNDTELKKLLSACGFVTDDMDSVDGSGSNTKLKELLKAINKVKEALKKGCNNADSQQSSLATTAHKEGAKEPKTIRDMMLWLQGLPYCPQFHELTKKIREKCEKLQGRNNNGVTCEKVLENLFDTACRLPGMFLTVEGTSSYFMKDLMEGCLGYTNEQCFMYKENGEELLKQFCEYTYKVHTQLRYLMNMCSYGNENGGWWQCILRHEANGQGNARSNPVKCKCKGYAANGCSQPLKAFLNQNKTSAQGTSDADHNIPMGFDRHNPSRTLFNGWDLYYLIKELIDPINTSSPTTPSKPLSLLTQYCVAIGQLQPQSLGDLFAFFAHLGQSWETLGLYGQNGDTFKQKLETELNGYKIGNGGEQESCDELEKKIKAIIPTTHSSHSNDRSLMSLMCTNNTNNASGRSNGCTPYMKSLSQGVYHYYQLGVEYQQNQFHLLQYLYDMLRKLLDGMKALKEAFDKCECCKNTSTCQGLIQCQYAHPILYKFGFVFGKPGSLNDKKCDTLKDQLDAVLSCKKDHESALFKAFECVIQVTYSILLKRAKEKVTGYNWNGKVTSADDTKKAFENYVHNAMYSSYPKLICTFACKVFKGGDCDGECEKFRERITKPEKEIKAVSSAPITVTKSAVTTITAVIPSYTAPVIDQYHYRMFTKKSDAQSKGEQNKENMYDFSDAIDFHVQGAQCISPAPVALRSVIDWILRITVGVTAKDKSKDENNNENIKALCDAVKSVLGSGVSVDEVEKHIVSLVKGLRKFVGYEDKSESVKTNVTTVLGKENNNGVKKLLGEQIEKIKEYLNGKDQFASELGRALLKGRYEVESKSVVGSLFGVLSAVYNLVDGVATGDVKRGRTFAEVVKILSNCLTHTHTCQTGLNCTNFQANAVASKSTSTTVTAEGLTQLHDFFEKLKTFAALWTSIGKTNGSSPPQANTASSDVVHTQKTEAMNAKWNFNDSNGSASSNNGQYFTKLHEALKQLGACASHVQALNSNNGSVTDSQQYRTKITELITGLEAFNTALNASDPVYAVNGADELIKLTKSKVEIEITSKIKEGVEGKYEGQNGNCSAQSPGAHTQHTNLQNYICIQTLIAAIEGAITSNCDEFKSHLDDLKQLCQWLYRMGQLYAHGLKGFVESLVSHLEHIVQVIKWIEGIEKMMTKLKDISDKDKLCETINDLNGLSPCCNTSGHNNLYNSNKFSNRDGFFTALNCRINNLLGSYVLGPLPEGSDEQQNDTQKVQERRQLLRDLRLLALDRYTLQVWQDECNPNDSRQSAIKDWITFEDGIVRHSDLDAIKEKLHDLTGIAYSSTASNTATAYSLTNRIQNFHAICVIQKFSYEAPITRLERSLKELEKIKDKLSAVKQKCNNGTQDLSSDPTVIKPFCNLVSQFLKDPYGVYSFAKFVHTILGPNIFSAVIGALEELTTEKLSGLKGNGEKKAKFCGIVNVMTEGLEGENGKMNTDYKLSTIITKLSTFITTLRKEYIFAYPVVTCKAQQNAAAQSQPQALATTASPPTATDILQQLKSVTLPCPSDLHNESSICPKCYELFPYILLGQIPKLYHSFRFMSWMLNNGWKVNQNGASNRVNDKIKAYLVSMGYDNDKIQNVQGENPSQGAMNTQLHTTFKKAVEKFNKNPSTLPTTPPTTHHFPGLKEIHDMLEQLLKKLQQVQHEQALQSIAKGSTDKRRKPRTIRDMLHWLSGVPFSVGYSEMRDFSNSLCDLTKAVKDASKPNELVYNIQPEWISYRLGVSCAECLDVLQAVEDPLGKEPRKRFKEYIATHDFYYPASASQLFYMFVDIIYNVYVQMKFVCNMTGRERNDGGWKSCEFINTKALILQNYNKDTVQCKCNLNFVEYTCAGPLRRLLCSVSTVFTGRSLGFQLPKEKLYNAPVLGSAIHNVIKHIFGSSNNYSVLCRLLLAVSSCPPTSIGDMICFLYWYRQTLFASTSTSGGKASDTQIANVYRNALHKEIELFPGTYDPRILTNALGALMSEHGAGGRTAGNNNHNANMLSILNCYGTAEVKTPATAPQQASAQQPSDPSVTCAPYLRPLAYDIYKIYVPQFSRAYLSWILHFGPRVYTALEEIKGKLNVDCTHCTTNNSIVTCNAVLPELYSKGLDFCDPKVLNGQRKDSNGAYQTAVPDARKTCTLFATQLDAVLTTCSPGDPKSPGAPLHRLIEAIEQFLWSIRMPFSLVQLSLWSFAVLFISYVFVVPLDHFKIKSHLFNRLKYTMHPSLLIADGQRRVSEVAYFSL